MGNFDVVRGSSSLTAGNVHATHVSKPIEQRVLANWVAFSVVMGIVGAAFIILWLAFTGTFFHP